MARLVPRRRRVAVEGRGRRLTMRANLRFGLATVFGVVIEYVYLVRVNPPAASIDDALPIILATIAVVGLIAAADGVVHMRHLLRPVEAWLTEDRPATPEEREQVLRLPWNMVTRSYCTGCWPRSPSRWSWPAWARPAWPSGAWCWPCSSAA